MVHVLFLGGRTWELFSGIVTLKPLWVKSLGSLVIHLFITKELAVLSRNLKVWGR